MDSTGTDCNCSDKDSMDSNLDWPKVHLKELYWMDEE